MPRPRHGEAFEGMMKHALIPLWLAVASALLLRAGSALLDSPRGLGRPSALDRVDLLTSSGCTMAWLGSGALWASTWAGWASLSVVGVLGLTVLYGTVLWTCIRVGGGDPWRRSSLSRAFIPASATEEDAVREELRFADARIPAGFRLFATGRVGPRWPTVRYALESANSSGDVVLASEVGPAIRGDHEAEPVDVWLEDVLGLCHSVHVRAGAAQVRVLPKPPRVSDVNALFARDGHDDEPRVVTRLPTEGSMHLREYAPGDDARRIHWVRSLAAGEIVVRLPDEVPRDRPVIELALDTFFPGAAVTSACDGPAELLDAMVRVWLGLGQKLSDQGARVTLVTAVPNGDERTDPCHAAPPEARDGPVAATRSARRLAR